MSNFNAEQYWETRLRKNFSAVGVGNQRMGKQYNEWLYRIRKYIFPKLIRKNNLDVRDKTVLDVGSGTGFYIDRWKELQAAAITGMDITQIAVEKLTQKYPDIPFIRADIGGELVPPLAGQQFDIISCIDVLYHIMDDEHYARAIRNIYSLLKPGGVLLFSENFLHHTKARGPSQTNRSLREIETLVTEAGFQIQGRYPMFIIMAYPVDTRSRFWKLLWLAIFGIGTINEVFGFIFGAILFPIEVLLLALFKESPTSEMMVCKKIV